jgi:hypothetical protein
VSAYRTSIDATADTINRRARYFRNQVIIVSGIGLAVAAAAMIVNAKLLWGWLLLIPACGLFFYIDSRVVASWCADVLAPWTRRELDLAAWLEAVRAHPVLPKGTLEGMLARLPAAGDLLSEQQLQAPTRRAIAARNRETNHLEADHLLIRVLASAFVVAALLTALALRTWLPLVGLVLLGFVPLVSSWRRRRRAAERDAEVALCRAETGFSEKDVVRISGDAVVATEKLSRQSA